MRNFDYSKKWEKLLTPEIVALLTQIHEYKGEQSLFIEAKADTLTQLVEIAKIQSTEASNKIEGIYTSDARLKALVKDKTTPKTRNECEIAAVASCIATRLGRKSTYSIPLLYGRNCVGSKRCASALSR